MILATAPDSKSISAIINGLGYNGELIIVSTPGEPIQLFPWQLFQGRRAIKGWIASRNETADALNFSVSAKIVLMIEVFPLEQAALAFDKMMASKVRFRSVPKMNN